MPGFDPYDILGLSRAATPAAVKTAYRTKAQLVHPDRGGEADAFVAVVRAFGVLSDPDARRLYDETGVIDEDGVRNYRREVAEILADMFDTAVETAISRGLKLQQVDFIQQLTAAVTIGVTEARKTLGRTDGEIESLRELRGRIRRNGEGHNLFAERLDTQIAAKTTEHAAIKRRLLLLDTAIVELGNYESEVELIAALEAAQ